MEKSEKCANSLELEKCIKLDQIEIHSIEMDKHRIERRIKFPDRNKFRIWPIIIIHRQHKFCPADGIDHIKFLPLVYSSELSRCGGCESVFLCQPSLIIVNLAFMFVRVRREKEHQTKMCAFTIYCFGHTSTTQFGALLM